MKALYLWEHKASAIASGAPDIQLPWGTDYRGPLLIVDAVVSSGPPPVGRPGGAACVVELVGCDRVDGSAPPPPGVRELCIHRWRFGAVRAVTRVLVMVESEGLWDVPADVVVALARKPGQDRFAMRDDDRQRGQRGGRAAAGPSLF